MRNAKTKKKSVIVIGHRNPDTDSICAAIGYAHLKNELNGGGYVAGRAGEINEETECVLNRFNVAAPMRYTNVYRQVEDLELFRVKGLPPETSMRKAWKSMRDQDSASQPVSDAKTGDLLGLITLNDLSRGNMDSLSATSLADSHTPVRNVVEILHGEVLTGDIDAVIDHGKISVGAGQTELMESMIGEGDLVIVSNRLESQIAAIDAGAGIIVICNKPAVSKTVRKLAEERKVMLIVTAYDTYAAARLVVQAVPIQAFMTPDERLVKFYPSSLLDEVQNIMSETRHVYFPVQDQEGKYLGLISRGTLMNANGKKLILVDHNERTQCIEGFEDAEILEIIDHHRIGSLETPDPVRFRNEPVGCTSTIVTEMYNENNVEIPKDIAGLLLSAIMSDTLAFGSPTCTDKDREIAKQLSEIAGVDPMELAADMFEAGENLEGKKPEDICYADFKVFTHGAVRFGVGQGSYMSPKNLDRAMEMMEAYLPKTLEHDNTNMAYFMLTDVKEKSSYLLCAGEDGKRIIKAAFGDRAEETDKTAGGYYLKGVVSRKKQLIPEILEVL